MCVKLWSGLIAILLFGSSAVADVQCGISPSVTYPGTPPLSTVIKLPAGFNGISIDPPPTTYDDKHKTKDGKKITATYRWEHVGTFATRSGTGSFDTTYWQGVTNSSSITTGFGFSVSASQSAGVGVPEVAEVTGTLQETFQYSSHITNSMTSYQKAGRKHTVTLKPNSAVQVWRLAIDFAAPTGASYTLGTTNTITCTYELDFNRPLQILVMGEPYDVPRPPDKSAVFPPPPEPKHLYGNNVSLLRHKPKMQAEAFYHWKAVAGARWGHLNIDDSTRFWSNLNLNGFNASKVSGWANCGLLGVGPANPKIGLPFYPGCPTGETSPKCLVAGAKALGEERGCLSYPCLPLEGCPYTDGNTGPCYLKFSTVESTKEFIESVCTDWSTIAAGGVPEWMRRGDWVSTDPLHIVLGWNSIETSDSSAEQTATLTYSRGVAHQQSGEEEFSASLGVEVEASGTLDVVTVSGKLSTTVSGDLKTAWGLELSEDETKTFTVNFSKPVAYDAYNLSATYLAGTSTLNTLANFVIVLDDGGDSATPK